MVVLARAVNVIRLFGVGIVVLVQLGDYGRPGEARPGGYGNPGGEAALEMDGQSPYGIGSHAKKQNQKIIDCN